MRIRLLATGSNLIITRDNVKVSIETSVAFRVTNPVLVYYRIGGELDKSVRELVVASFRTVLASRNLQEILS